MLNFVFCRHGNSCGNVSNALGVDLDYADPSLTHYGIEGAKYNAPRITRWLRGKGILQVDMICTSLLLRTMDTAYAMFPEYNSRFAVYPYLRELDESGKRRDLQTIASYMYSGRGNQKMTMDRIGLPSHVVDYSLLDKIDRKEFNKPGDIQKFIEFFKARNRDAILKGQKAGYDSTILCFTHAGVIKDMQRRLGEKNPGMPNCGVILLQQDSIDDTDYEYDKLYPADIDYKKYATHEYLCPSNRCPGLCEKIVPVSKTPFRLKPFPARFV